MGEENPVENYQTDEVENDVCTEEVCAIPEPRKNKVGSVLKKLEKPFKVGSMEFAPVVVPWERRKQTLAVLLWSLIMPLFLFFSFLCIRANGVTLVLFLLYVSWMIFFQDYHRKGGHPSRFMKSLPIWKWFRDYFPINLVKTAELPTDRSYIFGYHPHGIIGIGAFCNFATEATKFSEKFPGINLRLLTLTSNFKIPFYGFFLTSFGVCDASKESCGYILEKKEGNSLLLVLGGAKEALDAHPGQYILTLKNRKGFVKIGLRHGASLVPVFSFGENDAFMQIENPRGSILRKIQNALQQKMGFSLPLFHGRGVFTYSHGILPLRRPITSVVGEPIDLPRLREDEITPEIIDKYHSLYIEALSKLFDEHKGKYAVHETSLKIM